MPHFLLACCRSLSLSVVVVIPATVPTRLSHRRLAHYDPTSSQTLQKRWRTTITDRLLAFVSHFRIFRALPLCPLQPPPSVRSLLLLLRAHHATRTHCAAGIHHHGLALRAVPNELRLIGVDVLAYVLGWAVRPRCSAQNLFR